MTKITHVKGHNRVDITFNSAQRTPIDIKNVRAYGKWAGKIVKCFGKAISITDQNGRRRYININSLIKHSTLEKTNRNYVRRTLQKHSHIASDTQLIVLFNKVRPHVDKRVEKDAPWLFPSLPLDVYPSIFSYLAPKDLLKLLSLNKAISNGANGNYLWKNLCNKIWGDKLTEPLSWKEIFLQNRQYEIPFQFSKKDYPRLTSRFASNHIVNVKINLDLPNQINKFQLTDFHILTKNQAELQLQKRDVKFIFEVRYALTKPEIETDNKMHNLSYIARQSLGKNTFFIYSDTDHLCYFALKKDKPILFVDGQKAPLGLGDYPFDKGINWHVICSFNPENKMLMVHLILEDNDFNFSQLGASMESI